MPSGDAGPSQSSTPPATPPQTKIRRRSRFSIGSASPTTPPSAQIEKVNKTSAIAENGIDLNAAGSSRATRPAQEFNRDEVRDRDGDELLTIDGDLEKIVRGKKKRGSSGDGDWEAMRMQDLSGSSSRDGSRRIILRLAHDPGGPGSDVSGNECHLHLEILMPFSESAVSNASLCS